MEYMKKIVPLNVSPKCLHFAYPAVNPVTQSFVIIKAGIFPKSHESCKQPFANNDIFLGLRSSEIRIRSREDFEIM